MQRNLGGNMESSLAEDWDWRWNPPRRYGRLTPETRHGSHELDQLLC